MHHSQTILVVEPDVPLAHFLAEVLEEAGYVVLLAHNRPSMYVTLAANEPDLVLYAAEWLQGLEAAFVMGVRMLLGPMVPIVRVSTAAHAVALHGVTASLRKPFDLDELEACIAAHLRLREHTV